MTKIAIVLLNYNSSADCRKCIGFLQCQQGVEIEIMVVDNNSCPDDCATVEKLCRETGCTFINASENRGYNAGNNIGLRYASEKGYKYALVANPDMEFPQADYLKGMVKAMQQEDDIVVVGSDIVTPEGLHQNPMSRDGDWRGSWNWVTDYFKRKPKDTYNFIDCYAENHYCSKVSGCCLLVKMDFIKRIGFFDEGVFLYCEEAILSRQVEQRGKKMYYLAEARAIHRHVRSEKGDPTGRFEHWKRSRLYYINRYSSYPWYGKWLAGISMRLYVALMILYYKLKF